MSTRGYSNNNNRGGGRGGYNNNNRGPNNNRGDQQQGRSNQGGRQNTVNNDYSGNSSRQGGGHSGNNNNRDNRSSRGGDRGRGRGGSQRGGHGGSNDRQMTLSPTDGNLLVNYFKMHLNLGTRAVYRHGIDFQGEDSRFIRRKIIRQILVDNYGAKLSEVEASILFDDTCIYSPSPLKVEQNVDLPVKIGDRSYTIKIASMTQVKGADPQLLNIIFNKALSACNLQRIGRGYYDRKELDLSAFPKSKKDLQIFPGFHTEVLSKLVASQRDIMTLVNIDPTSKVLCRETVADVIYDIQGDDPWTSETRKLANRELIGQVVYTRYNYQTYTIEGIDYGRTAFTKFRARNRKTRKEEEMTYVEYYKQKGLEMKYPELVLIKTKGHNGSRIHLIPEFCLITDIKPEARRDLPRICSVKPPERMTRIKALPDLLLNSPNSKKILDSFGVNVETSPVSVPSKTLNPPKLITPTRSFEYQGAFGADLGKDFAFNFDKSRVLNIIVTYDNYTDCKNLADYYVKEIGTQLKSKKSPVVMGKIEYRSVNNNELHLPALTKILTDNNITDMLSILYLSFLSNKRLNKKNYEALKEYTVNKGIIHQNIDANNSKHSGPGSATVVSNIMKQIVNKFGHLCWWSPIQSIDAVFKNKTLMFIGIDVHHAKKVFEDNADEEKKVYRQRRSIGAFTATIITPNGTYLAASAINPHYARRELISRGDSETSSVASGKSNKSQDEEEELAAKEVLGGIGYMKENALKNFIDKTMTKHNVKPDFIFVYRDGVAESQLSQVKEHEVKQVRAACTTAALTYMVVQKRISTRFLVQTKDGQVANPAPGTLVDEFKSPVHDDFYLISLKSTISTVKPVRYIVVEDDKKVSRGTLQQMTHNLCFLYPNWADAIKLPFPTQLAHKLAFMVGENIKVDNPDVHENLFNTYYYL